MPMPSSTTVIRFGVPASSFRPVSIAAPATAPPATPPMKVTASSGSRAARTLRNASTFSRMMSPMMRAPPTLVAISWASVVSTVSARPPVNPVRIPASANCVRAASRKAR